MPTPIFPAPQSNRLLGWRGIIWGMTKKVLFKTNVQTTFSGRDAAQQLWSRPKVEIALKWSFLRENRTVPADQDPAAPREEYRRLHAWFEARRGRFEPFFLRFSADGDHYVADQLIHASTPVIGTDPKNLDSRNYQILRTFGGVVFPVGGVDEATSVPVLEDDGVPIIGVTWNAPKDGWARLPAAPSAGSVLRFTGDYYFRVAFKRDETEFEAFANDFWRNKTVLLESRWW